MGQARHRGSFEERKAQSIARQEAEREEARRKWDEEQQVRDAARARKRYLGSNRHAALLLAAALAGTAAVRSPLDR